MTNPRLADKIIMHLLLELPPFKSRTAIQLAKEINEDPKVVEKSIFEINKRHHWLKLRRTIEKQLIIEKFEGDPNRINYWIRSGGYTSEQDTIRSGEITFDGETKIINYQVIDIQRPASDIDETKRKVKYERYLLYFLTAIAILFGLMVFYGTHFGGR